MMNTDHFEFIGYTDDGFATYQDGANPDNTAIMLDGIHPIGTVVFTLGEYTETVIRSNKRERKQVVHCTGCAHPLYRIEYLGGSLHKTAYRLADATRIYANPINNVL